MTKKTKQVTQDELAEALQDLYWTLHRHSKASNKMATIEWLKDRDSDVFDSKNCISGTEFEKYMAKARKLINKLGRANRRFQ